MTKEAAPRRPKVSERLLAMIRRDLPELEIPEGARLEREPAARAEAHRKNGCWSWRVVDRDGIPLQWDSRGDLMSIGSHWPMGLLLKTGVRAHRDSLGDICIDPPDELQAE